MKIIKKYKNMKHQLPQLNYPYDALEPYIDKLTMEIHHTKHHQTYVDKLNTALEKYPELQERSLEDLIKELDNLPIDDKDKLAIKNHGGGHLNHSLFWQIMGPEKIVDEKLQSEIEKKFGSIDNFKKIFSDNAISHFGSGWSWLVRDENGELMTYALPNQESPYLKNHTPIMTIDVWEHAYYLKYQNRRAEYIENWWKTLKILK